MGVITTRAIALVVITLGNYFCDSFGKTRAEHSFCQTRHKRVSRLVRTLVSELGVITTVSGQLVLRTRSPNTGIKLRFSHDTLHIISTCSRSQTQRRVCPFTRVGRKVLPPPCNYVLHHKRDNTQREYNLCLQDSFPLYRLEIHRNKSHRQASF